MNQIFITLEPTNNSSSVLTCLPLGFQHNWNCQGHPSQNVVSREWKKKLIIAAALSTATNFQVNIICLALKFILCWFIMLVLQLHSIKTMSQHIQRKSFQTAWANCSYKGQNKGKKGEKRYSLTLLFKYRPSLWLTNSMSAKWHAIF